MVERALDWEARSPESSTLLNLIPCFAFTKSLLLSGTLHPHQRDGHEDTTGLPASFCTATTVRLPETRRNPVF